VYVGLSVGSYGFTHKSYVGLCTNVHKRVHLVYIGSARVKKKTKDYKIYKKLQVGKKLQILQKILQKYYINTT
jgi:hypothetical protein